MTSSKLGTRTLLALCVPAVMGVTAPAAAAGVPTTDGGGTAVEQQQDGAQSNSTDQRANSFADSLQVAPAVNLGLLNSGDQAVAQDNDSHASSTAGNHNSTGQVQEQHQSGSASGQEGLSMLGSLYDEHHGSDTSVHQDQSADQSNSTDQRANSGAGSTQVNPGVNVGVLNSGDQSVAQDNDSHASSTAGNHNSTGQVQEQHQEGAAHGSGSSDGDHAMSSGDHHGTSGGDTALDQSQDGTQENSTDQRANSGADSTQVNPGVNLGVLNSGDQHVEQHNDSSAESGASNENETEQHQTQSQLGSLLGG